MNRDRDGLRRFECLLAPTKAKVLAEHRKIKNRPETVIRSCGNSLLPASDPLKIAT